MPEQKRGADPGKVIDRLSMEIAEKAKQLAIGECIIEDQENEIGRLRAQLAELSDK